MLFASAVPLKVGVVVVIRAPFNGKETTGALGAVVSTVKVFVLELADVFPAASVAVTFIEWLPCVNEALALLQLPEPSAVTESFNTPST